jgi:hypothetical protein
MDSNTDDRDPEVPPEVPADELQQALQWLEELTGPSGNVPAADETADSPFQGLVDDGAGDLPDWLREAPKEPVEARLADDGEFESRLDWLAKMAERESIEELPTLEWRNLSDTPQPPRDDAAQFPDDTLPPTFPSELPVEAAPPEPLTAEVVLLAPESLRDEALPPANALAAEELAAALPDSVPGALQPDDELAASLIDDEPDTGGAVTPITPEALIDTLPPDEELPPIDDLDAAMAWIEELAASQDAPIEDVPSVADRALASKMLMEAGLSPDGLDRRLPGDELALGDLSLLEGNTPVNAFVAAEDFADTIVLVETMAADQGRALPEAFPAPEMPDTPEGAFEEAMAFLDELAADQEPLGAQTQPLDAVEAPEVKTVLFFTEELQFAGESPAARPAADEELVAPWLTEPEDAESKADPAEELAAGVTEADGIEPEWVVAEVDVVELELSITELDAIEPELAGTTETTNGLEPNAALSAEDAPWLEETAAEPAAEWQASAADRSAAEAFAPAAVTAAVLAVEGANANGNPAATLEETLRALDALALPPGRSLAEFDATLPPAPARRDLPAAVEWLELALGISAVTTPPPQWSDDELITQMPDDPDAVLAWLEQLAEEDTVDSSPQLSPTAETRTDADQLPAAGARFDQAVDGPEPLIDELSAADLQNMPDDPDAVMAWLEGLAGGRGEAADAAPGTPAPPVPPVPPALPTPSAAEPPAPTPSGRSRRRRGRKSQPAVVAASVAPAIAEATSAPDWEAVDEVTTPDVTMATVTPDESAVEVAGALAWEATDEVVAPDVTIEGAEAVAMVLSDEAGVAPTAEAEVDAPASTGVEEALAAPEATGEPVALPLPARPRRRGRKPKAAPETSGPAAEFTTGNEAADTAETGPQPSEIEETPQPAKPASWVDLLKPLK